mgnify:CR=1 FL=1
MTDLEARLIEASDLLKASPRWTLFIHQKADGDAVGSASALFEAGSLLGRRVRWMGPDASIPESCRFLPHTEAFLSCEELVFDDPEELYVFLDSSNEERGVRGLRTRSPDTVVLNLDHHEDNSRYGTLNCVDPSCSSTTELLYRLFKAGGWTLTPAIAESLYTGIVTDTGAFMYSNTTPRAHRMAADLLELGVEPSRIGNRIYQSRSPNAMGLWGRALSRVEVWGGGRFALTWLKSGDFVETGALSADTEGLVNHLMTIQGVRFAMLLSELEPGRIKASFRSGEGAVPAATVARSLGGGGHPRAAGVTLGGSLEEALGKARAALEELHAQWLAAPR